MLRISPATDSATLLRLKLEGQVRGPWVPELRRVCGASVNGSGTARPLELDLEGVTFIDAAGVALFGELVAKGALVTNCSPFIAEQLKGVGDAAK